VTAGRQAIGDTVADLCRVLAAGVGAAR
jgi:hypothetical protein